MSGNGADLPEYPVDEEDLSGAGGAALSDPMDAPPPQLGIIADVAAGKSEAIVAIAVESPRRRVAVFGPAHVQLDEMRVRINAAGGAAGQWRGTGQADPDAAPGTGDLMCRRSAEMDQVVAARGEKGDLCGSKGRGYCPYHEKGAAAETCGWRKQWTRALDGDITTWLLPHANLAHGIPEPLKDLGFDLVMIDEAPFLGMLGGFDEEEPVEVTDALLSIDWTVGDYALEPSATGAEFGGEPGERVNGVRSRIRQALARNGLGPLRKASFQAENNPEDGLSAERCVTARHHVGAGRKDPAEFVRPAASESIDPGLARTQVVNREIELMCKLFELAAELLRGADALSPYLTVEKDDAAFSVRMRYRQPIHKHWLARPIMHLDATMNEAVVRQWLSRLVIIEPREIAAVPKGVYIRQIWDSSVSHHKISPSPKANDKDQKTQRNNAALVRWKLEVMAWLTGGQGQGGADAGAIMPKATEEEIRAHWQVPDRVVLAHLNHIRGLNSAEGVRYLAVVGRVQAPVDAVEKLGGVIFGRVVESIVGTPLGEKGFPVGRTGRLMADGTCVEALEDSHPDPAAEAVREQITKAELYQAVARARHSRREETSPLLLDIVTNVPLPFPVDELITWDEWAGEADPLMLLMARGIVPKDMRGRWLVLRDWVHAKTENALKKWLGAHPEAARRFADTAWGVGGMECVPFSIGNPLLSIWRTAHIRFTPMRYRRLGDRKGSKMLVRADLIDAKAAAERYMGPLDIWEPIAIEGAVAANVLDNASLPAVETERPVDEAAD